MREMRAGLLAVLVATATLAAWPPAAARAESFSPAQREEIIGILREALKRDPSILRDALVALQAEEGARQAAAASTAIAAARPALVADAADPVAGNPVGDVTIVEFFDTRCPYCRRLDPTMAELLARDHGIRLVYKDLPVLGPPSVLAAKALLAAQKQHGYEALRTAVMREQAPPDKDRLLALAKQAGLDPARLAADMDDPGIAQRINANLDLARSLGIDGTPAMVIGDALVPGAVELPELQQAVRKARGQRG
jgi:protein-disulfide isomerase